VKEEDEMIGYKDLRDWMDQAQKIGELKLIEGGRPS